MMDQTPCQDNAIDIIKLNEAFMGDLSIIRQILSAFQETVANFQQDFKNLVEADDAEQLSRLAHGLKGSAANIRAEKVARQAAHVQMLIDQDQNYSTEAQELFVLLSQLNDKINSI